MRSAKSVHKVGSMTYRGKTDTNVLTMAGPHSFSGSYVSTYDEPVKFVSVGRDTYVRSNLSYWERFGGASGSGLLSSAKVILPLSRGRWAKNPSPWWINHPAPMVITPSQTLERAIRWFGPFKKDGETNYAGRKVIALRSRYAKLYLLPKHRAYPVAVVWDGPAWRGRTYHLTFDHWDAPLRVSVPKDAYDLKGRGPYARG